MKRAKAAGAFLGIAVSATALFWTAWAMAWFTFGKLPDLLALLVYAALPAWVFALLLRLRKKDRSWRIGLSLKRSLAGALILYAALCGLHFARPRPTRFAFLGETPMAFPTDPGMPGLFGAIYTFPANPDRLAEAAETELRSKGFRIDRRTSNLSAYLSRGSDSYNLIVAVGPGRATGQHYHIDGDYVHVEKRDGWVTVDVVEPDTVPPWVSEWLP